MTRQKWTVHGLSATTYAERCWQRFLQRIHKCRPLRRGSFDDVLPLIICFEESILHIRQSEDVRPTVIVAILSVQVCGLGEESFTAGIGFLRQLRGRTE